MFKFHAITTHYRDEPNIFGKPVNTFVAMTKVMVVKRSSEVTWERDLLRGSGIIRFGTNALPAVGVSWASRTEQPNGKTSPEELLAAAHASCYAMALSGTLAKNKTPPSTLIITAVCTLDQVENSWKVTTMELTVNGTVPGIDESTFKEIAKKAEETCPISNTLRNNVDIQLEAVLE
jgi:osmotically inducible protein OsmC